MQVREPMKTESVYLGIDVSKKSLHLGSTTKFIKEFANTKLGIQKLVAALKEIQPTMVVMEASGGYERICADAIQDCSIPINVAQPGCVRHFAKSIKVLAKTDAIDAQVIARFGEATNPQPTARTPENVKKFRAINDRREQIIEDRVRETNRLETCADKEVAQQLQDNIRQLEEREYELTRRMNELRNSDYELRTKSEVMMQQKGVGSLTACTLLAHLPELGAVDRQQVAALAGMAPHARESGKWKGKRSIYGGRAKVRKAMFMAARSAVRWCPIISLFYKRLRENGKPFKVAIIACARKMLIRLNTLIKNMEFNAVETSTT